MTPIHEIHVEGNRNHIYLKREDLLRFVEAVGHAPVYIDLPDPRKEEGGAGTQYA